MCRLDCSHIVRFKAACLLPGHRCIVTELCTRGSLYDALYGPTPHRRIKTLKDILTTAREISAAMAYLHPVIVHRDLKPANVLMTEDGIKVRPVARGRGRRRFGRSDPPSRSEPLGRRHVVLVAGGGLWTQHKHGHESIVPEVSRHPRRHSVLHGARLPGCFTTGHLCSLILSHNRAGAVQPR